ncbi:MAG: hypothetical protein QG671_2722 [Actinomycetota bacterium]|nr:hypothetical protein [Actinomycetota bacterium]
MTPNRDLAEILLAQTRAHLTSGGSVEAMPAAVGMVDAAAKLLDQMPAY